jgi:apolipoprotein N-acyltransferase
VARRFRAVLEYGRAGADLAAGHSGRGLAVTTAGLAAVIAGLALLVAFPPYGRWWAAPVGVALLAVAVHGHRARTAGLFGLLTGLTFFVPLLSFTGLQVGWWPWLLLATLQAVFVAGMAAAAAAAGRLIRRRMWAWPLVTGLCWVAQEAIRSRVPFGGFPWGRLAFSQADAPLLPLATIGGAPLVTFAVAVTGGLLAVAVWASLVERRAWRRPLACIAAALLLVTAAATLPTATGAGSGREVVIAVVQGNVPRLGLDFNAQRQAVLDNHVMATLDLAADVAAGLRPKPALVIWPENSSDVDPLRDPDAATRIDAAARAVGMPILVGAVLAGDTPHTARNAALAWHPGSEPADIYVKRHPVPFAEYMPLRGLLRRVTSLVDRVRADFVAGTGPGVLDVGDTRVGAVICFEVAYDALVRDTAAAGAEVLVIPTNNATFNPAEAAQQLAMVRLRAVEHGRPAVMASTVGISAFADPDGSVHDATAFNTRAILVRTVTATSAPTIATRIGAATETLLVAAAAVLGAAGLARHRRRHVTDRTNPAAALPTPVTTVRGGR